MPESRFHGAARLGAVLVYTLLLAACVGRAANALQRPDSEFKVFQFPRTMMPRIDGDTADWDIVGEDYTYRTGELDGSTGGYPDGHVDTADIDVSVRVGWVAGMNRLYFLYEAYDDYWDFGIFAPEENPARGYQNDIFEVVVDGDLSGGQLIRNPQIADPVQQTLRFSGVHAQNYHIFTPPINDQWCMVWGGQPWIADFPWANYACDYAFKPGESGRLVLEFWITPFDYAASEGPSRSRETVLTENAVIGLSWAILDFDHGEKDGPGNTNLSHERSMVQDASALCTFRLMPLEERFLPAVAARFTFRVVDPARRMVYFKDETIGTVTRRLWHFGDGATSTEASPLHVYAQPGNQYTVWLDVWGPDGFSRHSKHWEVVIE